MAPVRFFITTMATPNTIIEKAFSKTIEDMKTRALARVFTLDQIISKAEEEFGETKAVALASSLISSNYTVQAVQRPAEVVAKKAVTQSSDKKSVGWIADRIAELNKKGIKIAENKTISMQDLFMFLYTGKRKFDKGAFGERTEYSITRNLLFTAGAYSTPSDSRGGKSSYGGKAYHNDGKTTFSFQNMPFVYVKRVLLGRYAPLNELSDDAAMKYISDEFTSMVDKRADTAARNRMKAEAHYKCALLEAADVDKLVATKIDNKTCSGVTARALIGGVDTSKSSGVEYEQSDYTFLEKHGFVAGKSGRRKSLYRSPDVNEFFTIYPDVLREFASTQGVVAIVTLPEPDNSPIWKSLLNVYAKVRSKHRQSVAADAFAKAVEESDPTKKEASDEDMF